MAKKTKRKQNSSFWSTLAIAFVFALTVIYTAYHLISFFTREEIHTIVSGVTTESVTVDGDGYVFRDEKVLHSNYSGAVDYFVEDGQKVALGQSLAHVYSAEVDENVQGMIATIDKQIELLEKCSGENVSSVDLSELRKSADDTYFTLTRLLASSEAGELDYQIEKMMLALTKIKAVVNGDASVVATIEELKSQREAFFGGKHEEVYSSESGYFYTSPDGYEAAFSLSALDAMDGNSFYSLINSVSEYTSLEGANSFGKLAPDSTWKFVLPIDPSEAEGFSEGEAYDVIFPENNNTGLSMVLEKKMLAYEQKSVLMVLVCDRLPDNFVFERCMTAQIERSSVSGIYVPRSSVAMLDGARGVYVLRGSVAHFRKIDIVYVGEDYYLVEKRDDKDGDYYYLGENELIITNGKNMFDGRIVE